MIAGVSWRCSSVKDDAELVLDRIGLFVGDRVRRTVAEQR
jgi:hypothetical protein